jgi:hypothetical protein
MTRNVILTLAILATTLRLVGGVVAGRHLVTCAGGECRGTKQADRIVGTTGNDAIAGRRGNDQIFGEEPDGTAGDDVIRAGAGDDTIVETTPARTRTPTRSSAVTAMTPPPWLTTTGVST